MVAPSIEYHIDSWIERGTRHSAESAWKLHVFTMDSVCIRIHTRARRISSTAVRRKVIFVDIARMMRREMESFSRSVYQRSVLFANKFQGGSTVCVGTIALPKFGNTLSIRLWEKKVHLDRELSVKGGIHVRRGIHAIGTIRRWRIRKYTLFIV